MNREREAAALRLAREVFRALAGLYSEHLLYQADHPRFVDGLERTRSALREFHEGTKRDSILFTLRPGRVEFCRVPLPDLGAGADRLADRLREQERAGLKLDSSIDSSGLLALVGTLRPSGAATVGRSGSGFRWVSAEEAAAKTEGISEFVAIQSVLSVKDLYVSEASVRTLLDSFRQLTTDVVELREADFRMLDNVTALARNLFDENAAASFAPTSGSYFDDFTFHHSLNVCLLTRRVASLIVSDPQFLERIAIAALLHDLGKTRVPLEIIYKPSRLTDVELAVMNQHPVHGADFLLGIDNVDPLYVAAAFGHHVHDGPRSYPTTHVSFRKHWIVQLISVIDTFEALTAVRPYKRGLSVHKAFEILLGMPGMQHRLTFLRALYEAIGPYPVGTYVELVTGERAVVVEPNPGARTRPKVQILADAQGRRMTGNEIRDLSLPGSEHSGIYATLVCQQETEDPLEVEAEPDFSVEVDDEVRDDRLLMAREG